MSDAEAIFLDASVVMYAAGAEHPLRDPCRRSLRRVVEEDLRLVTSSEVLQEILHRYFSLRRPRVAERVLRATRDLCSAVVPVGEEDAERALEILLRHEGVSPRDAIHVAVMEAHGLTRILSTDTDFDAFDTVRRVDPGRFG